MEMQGGERETHTTLNGVAGQALSVNRGTVLEDADREAFVSAVSSSLRRLADALLLATQLSSLSRAYGQHLLRPYGHPSVVR